MKTVAFASWLVLPLLALSASRSPPADVVVQGRVAGQAAGQ